MAAGECRMAPVTSRGGCWLRVAALLCFAVSYSYGGCTFPVDWSGSWFQSGAPRLLAVNSTHIDTKGECYEHDAHDKFLLYDKSDDCYRCMVIHKKHSSVLQYKETFCDKKTSLADMCDYISGDAPLYSMFRQQPLPKPEPCPFKQAPFSFTYNRGTGDCISPPSRAESCTDDSRLLLRYQACPDVPGTESYVEELVCLAEWKEGSTRYLVGKISQVSRRSSIMSDEDSYRCFVYKGNSHNGKITYNIAQSGDATCNGLISSTEGSKTMKLTTVDSNHNKCRFPSWITDHHTWHSLDHSRTYHFSQRNATLKISNEDGSGSELRIVCHSILAQSPDTKKIQINAHFTQGCDSGHKCMIFHKRDSGVMEVQHHDHHLYENADDACKDFNEDTAPYTTLITVSLYPKQCPHLGRYTVYDSLADRRKRRQQITIGVDGQDSTLPAINECLTPVYDSLAIGCTATQDSLEFKSSCSISSYSCHGSWSDKGVNYLIASPTSRASTDPRRYCFVYTMTGIGNETSTDVPHPSPRGRSGVGAPLSHSRLQARMHVSAISHSCDRTVQPGKGGDRAYNLTINGTCAQSSQYSGSAKCLSPYCTLSLLLVAILNSLIYLR